MSDKNQILLEAQFHPVIKTYLFILMVGWLFVSFIGIILIPFWLILGWFFCKRYYDHLECYLTQKNLVLKKGYLFHVEKTIPLDKIQDLTLKEGPLLRMLKICMLGIETAGQSSSQTGHDARLIGIIETKSFRDRVLQQRDMLADKGIAAAPHGASQPIVTGEDELLRDIRDTLHRIESNLSK